MGKPRMIGMIKRYIPNSKADMRYRRKAFELNKSKIESEEPMETKALLASAVADLKEADVNCKYCAYKDPPAPCAEDEDHYTCEDCPHNCYCKDCVDNSKWEYQKIWRKTNMQNYIVINGQKIDLTEEQVKQIAAAYNTPDRKLSDIPAGSTFKIGDYEFVVLEQLPEAAAVILKDLLPERITFGSNNNYDGSNPDQACCAFAKELIAAVGSENVLTHEVDLTADDGLKDYGKVERAVSLLTAPAYRKYVEILDKFKPDAWWWLATPFSTAAHNNDDWVECVAPSGCIYDGDCHGYHCGVRPFCILKSDIFVSN